MTRTINLTSREWIDLVFADKNQNYGAYEIRKTSTQRHLMSLIIVILLGAIFSGLPMIMKKIFPAASIVDAPPSGKITLVNIDMKIKEEMIKIIQPAEVVPLKSTVKFTPPVVTPDDQVSEADEIITQAALSDMKGISISVATIEGVVGGTEDIADHDRDAVAGIPTDDVIVDFAEQPPYFPGGEAELMSYLSKNIRYPVIAIETGVQGNVVLRFVVGKDGNIKDVTILRSLDPSCDREAVRVVQSMPQWSPGRQNGNPVAVYYTLPIRFKLNS